MPPHSLYVKDIHHQHPPCCFNITSIHQNFSFRFLINIQFCFWDWNFISQLTVMNHFVFILFNWNWGRRKWKYIISCRKNIIFLHPHKNFKILIYNNMNNLWMFLCSEQDRKKKDFYLSFLHDSTNVSVWRVLYNKSSTVKNYESWNSVILQLRKVSFNSKFDPPPSAHTFIK